jgi:hypothetical protein
VVYPTLHALVTVDEPGRKRLHRALDLGKAPISSYYPLAWARASEAVRGSDFKELVIAIGSKPDGLPIALEIVSMRLHNDGSDKRATVREVQEAGRDILSQYSFQKKGSRLTREDHQLSVVIKASWPVAKVCPLFNTCAAT